MLIKMAWAFMWQEQFSPGFMKYAYNSFGLTVGEYITPAINLVASLIDQVENTESDVKWGTELYPGARYCNTKSPHSLWHQQSADALIDLILVLDKMYGLI